VVTHQLQVERRTGKVRRPETDVLPLCHATVNPEYSRGWLYYQNTSFHNLFILNYNCCSQYKGVRPSVCLSHRSTAATAAGAFAAKRPNGRRYRSIAARHAFCGHHAAIGRRILPSERSAANAPAALAAVDRWDRQTDRRTNAFVPRNADAVNCNGEP